MTARSNPDISALPNLRPQVAYPLAIRAPQPASKTMLVLGATSEIAMATLKELAQDGWGFHLAGRNLEALAVLAQDLSNSTGFSVTYSYFDTAMTLEDNVNFWHDVLDITSTPTPDITAPSDASTASLKYQQDTAAAPNPAAGQDQNPADSSNDSNSINASTTTAVAPVQPEAQAFHHQGSTNFTMPSAAANSTLAGVFCAVGYLGKAHQAEFDLKEGQLIMQANYSGLIPVLSLAANYFERYQKGQIVVISSVAGERGRASNYAYGSAKAGMNAYLSGLRARLARSKVHVMTVLPGFVRTRMIADKPNARPCATPEQVAHDIVKGMRKRKSIVYSRWYWRYIMCVVKHLPEWLFKRITL